MEADERKWSELPTDLLVLIASRLFRRERARFLAVCKGWRSIATSVRVSSSPPGPAPCLLRKDKGSSYGRIYVPWRQCEYRFCIAELSNTRIRYAKGGWLILENPTNHTIYTFHLFTKTKIDLPSLKLRDCNCKMAFSTNPTSADCVFLTLTALRSGHVVISKYVIGDISWDIRTYPNNGKFHGIGACPLFYNNVFYCFDLYGRIGKFNASDCTWVVLSKPEKIISPPECTHPYESFFLESEGELVAVIEAGSFYVYKLDLFKGEWVRVKNLGDQILFTGLETSISASKNVRRGFRPNSIYLPLISHGLHQSGYQTRRYVDHYHHFSLGSRGCYPQVTSQDLYHCAWIQLDWSDWQALETLIRVAEYEDCAFCEGNLTWLCFS